VTAISPSKPPDPSTTALELLAVVNLDAANLGDAMASATAVDVSMQPSQASVNAAGQSMQPALTQVAIDTKNEPAPPSATATLAPTLTATQLSNTATPLEVNAPTLQPAHDDYTDIGAPWNTSITHVE